jgi:predicted transcriptional regulator of viral defense system
VQYRYLATFVDDLRSRGKYSFTTTDLRTQFRLSDEALKKAMQRLSAKKEAARVRQEFYVIIPPEYRGRGMLPVSFFITDLMTFLSKEYYVGLLSAAALYGAAHQQPQTFYVMTQKPTIRNIRSNTVAIHFSYKKEWDKADIKERKVETGYVKVSSPELTALDLVTYAPKAGGLNRVAAVLDELAEAMDKEALGQTIQRYGNTATVQRLGYLLEVIGRGEMAASVAAYLDDEQYFPVLLRPQKEKPPVMVTGNQWKVVANTEIETDL